LPPLCRLFNCDRQDDRTGASFLGSRPLRDTNLTRFSKKQVEMAHTPIDTFKAYRLEILIGVLKTHETHVLDEYDRMPCEYHS